MSQNKKELLPITPAQEMINFMLKYSFFHKQVIQIPASVIFTKKVDFDLMKKALNIEIQRNDCMRLRFVKKGGKYYQYFLDEYTLEDVPVVTFKTKEEQEAYLNADGGKTIHHMKGEIYRFVFFNTWDGRQGVYINVCHLVMDAAAVFNFYADLFKVYDALESGSEMPAPIGSFRKTVDKELAYINNAEKVNADKQFYTDFFKEGGAPIFNGAHGPELLEKQRIKKKNPKLRVLASFDPIHDKALLTKRPVGEEDSKLILKYLDESGVSPECLVQIAMRMFIAKLNESVNDGIFDTYFITLCTRRKTLNEKTSGGSLTSTLPWRIIIDKDLTFREGIDKLQELQRTIFRHQDYPFIDWRDVEGKIYNYGMADGASTMMFSWFPLEKDTMNGWDYEFTGYSIGRYVMPLYSYAMKDASNGLIKFAFLHRTNLISVENIDALAEGTLKALRLGCANPDMKLGDIMNQLG